LKIHENRGRRESGKGIEEKGGKEEKVYRLRRFSGSVSLPFWKL
jgi:hypothetical protein